MSGLCLGTAFTLIQAMVPATQFTLAWTHSVEKTVWQEDYRVEADRLVLTQARVQGAGAGMEPPADAVFDGRAWRYRPRLAPLLKLTLARSEYTRDYALCWSGRCVPLAQLLQTMPGAVDLFPCPPQK